MDDVKILATGLGFPEGPVVCADGSVVLTEIRNQRCSRGRPAERGRCFPISVGGHSMGVGPHPDYQFGTVERIDPKTGEAKLLYKEVGGHTLSAPNDLVF